MKDVEKHIKLIEKRNKKVELDKAWEVSWTRRLFILFATWITLSLYMKVIEVPNPWLNALIPTGGYFLSTLSLPFLRKFWLKHIQK